MYPKTVNRTVQGVLFIVLFTIFRKSGNPVVVLTLFLVLFGTVLNVYLFIQGAEIGHQLPSHTKQQNNRRVMMVLCLQIICLIIMGLLTWLLQQKGTGLVTSFF
jgi:accessory gene regulator protein AgrB